MTTPATSPAAGSGPGVRGSTELEAAVLTGATPLFDPFSGTDLSTADAPSFRAAELGLEAPRFCQLCGRRMVVQVNPSGWDASCSRHGRLSSSALDR